MLRPVNGSLRIQRNAWFSVVVQISCRGAEADSHGPTVCRTKEFPLLLDKVIVVPVVQVVRVVGP